MASNPKKSRMAFVETMTSEKSQEETEKKEEETATVDAVEHEVVEEAKATADKKEEKFAFWKDQLKGLEDDPPANAEVNIICGVEIVLEVSFSKHAKDAMIFLSERPSVAVSFEDKFSHPNLTPETCWLVAEFLSRGLMEEKYEKMEKEYAEKEGLVFDAVTVSDFKALKRYQQTDAGIDEIPSDDTAREEDEIKAEGMVYKLGIRGIIEKIDELLSSPNPTMIVDIEAFNDTAHSTDKSS